MHAQDTPAALSGDNTAIVKKCPDFEVTGDGSNTAWKNTEWINLTPHGKGMNYATKVKILYSSLGVYCMFHCTDNKITSTMKGDFLDLYREDVVEAFFWTDERIPVYFEYELSPYNFELPIMVPNINGYFLGWTPWHYEGKRLTRHAAKIITDERDSSNIVAWIAEFFIPFELLKPIVKDPPGSGTRWRANFYRLDYDDGVSRWTWMPVERNFHDYRHFGTLIFE
jgi:hypothetical protein